ncbi:hypothetical protein HN51_050909, partial [Arachis hypogaea]
MTLFYVISFKLQRQLDTYFLLAHMCSVKLKEWTLVLLTLLRSSKTHSRFIGREKLCNDGRYMKVNADFIFARYTSCFHADKVICSSDFLHVDLLERSDGFYSNIWTM